MLLFFAFFFAFAVKVPMWPVHTWLPDAHVEAPTGGSVVLAAIMLKLGAYGFLRFSLPITPDASHKWAWFMVALSLIAVVYIGFVALVQTDMKKLVAYSSIAHMGFVTLGFFLFDAQGRGNELAVSGAIVQMISHGFVSGAMFLCIGVLYDRVHSREIAAYGGVVNTMPKFAALGGAVRHGQLRPAGHGRLRRRVDGHPRRGQGELLDRGARRHDPDLGRRLHAVDGQARLLRRRRQRPRRASSNDLDRREFAMLGVLAAAVLAMGLYPKPFTDVMHASVARAAAPHHRSASSRRDATTMNWQAVYPEILLLAAACLVALVDLWVTDPKRIVTYWLTQASLFAARDAAALVLRRRLHRSTRCSAWWWPTRWATCSACSPPWR